MAQNIYFFVAGVVVPLLLVVFLCECRLKQIQTVCTSDWRLENRHFVIVLSHCASFLVEFVDVCLMLSHPFR